MRYLSLFLLAGLLLAGLLPGVKAQEAPLHFHHLSVEHGLNDPAVNAICQDKYGYMWFASLGAINRFNGTSIRRFTHVAGDTTTPHGSVSYAMACDQQGRIWIGYTHGMLVYDYENASFSRVHAFDGMYIYAIEPDDKGKIMLVTSKGLLYYNPDLNRFEDKAKPADTLSYRLMNNTKVFGITFHRGLYYIGTSNGLIIYDPVSRGARQIQLPELNGVADKIMVDAPGHIWVSNYRNFRLLRYDPVRSRVTLLDSLLLAPPKNQLTLAVDMRADEENVWIITTLKGLIQYDTKSGKFTHHRHNRQLPNSLTSDNLRSLYISRDGTVWINSPLGVDYFHPRRNFFQVVFPFPAEQANNFGRGMAEDKNGVFWFGTTDGCTRYDPVSGRYSIFRNEPGRPSVIHNNSVRGVVDDAEGNIWFATGAGVHRYVTSTGTMEFLDWKDSLPPSFYFSASKDSLGRLWFGTRDYDGFYFYDPRTRKIHSMASIPALAKYRGRGGRYLMEDSRKRLWLGFNGGGLVMYDLRNNETRHWFSDDAGPDSTIAGNLVVDIKEDKQGIIWVSSFGGLTGIDTDKNRYYLFTEKNGFYSNNVGPLAVDALDRLWIGTANGLFMLDSSRKNFTYFNGEDGLPSRMFTEHPGHYSRNGIIMMPTTHGFIRFDPLQIQPGNNSFNFFIAGIRVFDKPLAGQYGNEGAGPLQLKYDQNFFTIEFEALNYLNPGKIWYAYRLDGFDKDWKYTRDPKAVYTNVPGGNYTLRYKATADPNNWKVAEKTLDIRVATVFYKTRWFLLLTASLVAALLYWIYHTRLQNQSKVHHLQSRAQLLEKEKTLVMYESLKQQLNPHFLFNSLTSLSGLIETDQKMAGNFLEQMSKIYRYILKNRDSELVSLKEELDFVQVYINLQKTRFREGLQVHTNVSGEQLHAKVAPVTLQNLIENAIKHNIIDADMPLRIGIFTEGDYLVVRNNLQKKKVVETSNRQGLLNLRSLYHYLADKPVVIEEDETFFTIKVPLI